MYHCSWTADSDTRAFQKFHPFMSSIAILDAHNESTKCRPKLCPKKGRIVHNDGAEWQNHLVNAFSVACTYTPLPRRFGRAVVWTDNPNGGFKITVIELIAEKACASRDEADFSEFRYSWPYLWATVLWYKVICFFVTDVTLCLLPPGLMSIQCITSCLILLHWPHYVKTWRHPQNRKYIK